MRIFFLLSWAVVGSAFAEPDAGWLKQEMPGLVSLYQHLHRNPEVSFQEERTALRIAEELRKLGFDVKTKVGGHGVVAVLQNGSGKTLMIRTDLDALPVEEKTDLKFKSTVKGTMHACGHDAHMTNLVGTARFLASEKTRKLWKGTLILIGQPAEEKGMGAIAMLSDGLFKKVPKPDYALAFHVDPSIATGSIGYRPGYMMATADSVDIAIRGQGGHGSMPHTTIDPIVIAARLILDLQTITSRELAPHEPVVVTVGSIHAGTKHNIIPDSADLQLTVRTFDPKVRERVLKAIERKAQAACAASGAPAPKVVVDADPTPSVYNDPKLVEREVAVLKKLLGEQHLIEVLPQMVAEDFSRYGLAGVPISMFFLGSIEEKRLKELTRGGKVAPSLHTSTYRPDIEATLQTGVRAMSAMALDLLQ